ncbi:MAG: PAS domain S-box protein [Bacteroidetes bacterium]|jgi:PAS domain S-box-containing protein|nr:PAS domain S-box protein [Bacteroidota bacterium]MBT4400884.1 PAS domain S-box protein [Bacteroidota bacterium]MBT4408492.1 PAS domain S-box protein [Bacteroidota bacterium]MBT5427013.1 PAS domain S-box protein [Bacteroidota bacterium]MBT7092765.1 PAS domain S-box protein [Bacteroidota bacterium]
MKKRTYIYKGFERFWHWSQALLIFFLALTGFEIHGSFSLFGFKDVVKWHDMAAWAFIVLIVFAIFWHFATGEWKQYIPTTKLVKAQISYYITGIFKGAPHPTHKTIYNKFNPLQRLIYLGLKLLIIPLQVGTGLVYMFYIYPNNPAHVGGLGLVAIIHTFGAFSLLAFIIAHVYLTTTAETPLTSIKAMLTGWEAIDVDEKEERSKHLQQAVNDSAAGYYRIDSNGIFVDVNQAWLDFYKCTQRDQIIGKHYSITRDKKDLAELDLLVSRVLFGEFITGVPATRKCMDGSSGKHLLSANPVIENEEVIGMEGFVLNISEAEGLSEHMYYTVRNSGAGYYRLDDKGIIVEVNNAWLELYKYDNKEQIIGKHYSITRSPNEVENLEKSFNSVMKGETITGKIAIRKCRDGSTGRHILSANPVFVGNQAVGMEGFILDITTLEQD